MWQLVSMVGCPEAVKSSSIHARDASAGAGAHFGTHRSSVPHVLHHTCCLTWQGVWYQEEEFAKMALNATRAAAPLLGQRLAASEDT